MTLRTVSDLIPTDNIEVTLPKWNEQSRYKVPFVRDATQIYCKGILNTKAEIPCEMKYGADSDTVKLISPLTKLVPVVTIGEDGEEVTTMEPVTDFIIESGESISFEFGPITNPISTAPVHGFKIMTRDSKNGIIADGRGQLEVFKEANIKQDEVMS